MIGEAVCKARYRAMCGDVRMLDSMLMLERAHQVIRVLLENCKLLQFK